MPDNSWNDLDDYDRFDRFDNYDDHDDDADDGDADDGDADGDDVDEDEVGEEETAPCPECESQIVVDAEMCAACGYWLSTAERHAMWSGGSQATKLLSVGKVILVLVLVALMSGLMIL